MLWLKLRPVKYFTAPPIQLKVESLRIMLLKEYCTIGDAQVQTLRSIQLEIAKPTQHPTESCQPTSYMV